MTRNSGNNERTKDSPVSAGGDAGRRQHAPAAQRNTAPILGVLKTCLPDSGRALEIASGTGQHAVAFARAFPGLEWHPSDPEAGARDSIMAWREEAGLANLHPALDLDVSRGRWETHVDRLVHAVLAINLVHIAPWAVSEGLLRGAGELLVPDGLLYLYGPYRRGGAHTAESNVRFEQWLKAQSSEYGVRDLEEIEREGARHGLALSDAIPMPANNFSLIFRKEGESSSKRRA